MRKFLASLLNRMSSGQSHKAPPRKPVPEEEEEADTQAFESLAMTDELREALFPKTTQMVSAIFDRPDNHTSRPDCSAPPPSRSNNPSAPDGNSFSPF